MLCIRRIIKAASSVVVVFPIVRFFAIREHDFTPRMLYPFYMVNTQSLLKRESSFRVFSATKHEQRVTVTSCLYSFEPLTMERAQDSASDLFIYFVLES